jgi:Asp-tRNA(Asn)/Glu-tRNA(Gln) amidotransferase A subunit family amidase
MNPGGTATLGITASLAAVARWEPALHAFAWLDPERALALAGALDQRDDISAMPLYGMPVGIKDIFDTAGIPTEFGSPIFAGRVPTETADVVGRLEGAGAIVVGKMVTAELAHYSPGPTANPWRLDRTPGGSSMGSAAAVAAGMVPAAIGSQTNGSVIRPAAF